MASTTRDPWLDNAKMGLITLVVIGHLWAIIPAGTLRDACYDFVYLWHMPAFVFVAGHLSRTFTWSTGRLWSLVTTLAVPYVVFEAAMALFRTHVGGEQLDDLFADPHFPFWFLLALIVWRLLTPVLRPLWGGVAVAVAVSLSSGFLEAETTRWFDLARILGFLPFFVLGLKATPEHLDRLRSRAAIGLGVAVFAAIAVLAVHLPRWGERGFLYYRGYEDLDGSPTSLVLTRSLTILVGIAGTLAWLALTPRIGGWFARMGSATMVIYLLHGFAVKGLLYAGFDAWSASRPLVALLVAALLGTGISFLLAIPPVRRRLEPLVDPLGVAERTVDEAVELAAVVQDAESDDRPLRVGR